MPQETVQVQIKLTGVDQVNRDMGKLQSGLGGKFSKIAGKVATVAKVAAGAILAVGAASVAVGTMAVKSAAQLEQQRIGFITLLGSAEAADKALERIKKDAKATPFELPGLIAGNKRLISTGIEAERAADIILSLGDAISATGGSQPEFDRMITNLQQIKNVGRASAIDIKQFGFAGINIVGLLADSMEKTTAEVQALVTAGKIGFPEVEQALKNASSEGGDFFNAMQDQSQTLNGILSNVKDTINILLADFATESGLLDAVKVVAQGLLSFLEKAASGATGAVENMKIKFNEFMNSEFMKNARLFFSAIFDGMKSAVEGFMLVWNPIWDTMIEIWQNVLRPMFIEIKRLIIEMFGESVAEGEEFKRMMEIIGASIAIVVGGIVLAIAGLILIFGTLVKSSLERTAKVKATFENLKEGIRKVVFAVGWYFKVLLPQAVATGVNKIKAFWMSIPATIKRVANSIIFYMERAVNSVISGFNGVAESIPGAPTFPLVKFPRFESGGIVGGSSTSGDKVLARVNSGEMILNKAQQSSLFRMLQGSGGQTVNMGDMNFSQQGAPMQQQNSFINLLTNI